MRRIGAAALLVVSACGLYVEDDGDELPASVCEALLDDWETEIDGLGQCERDADCIVVGQPESCGDGVVISRSCGHAVNEAAYRRTSASAIEAQHARSICRQASPSGCDLPTDVACVTGVCRITERSRCPSCPAGNCGSVQCNPVTQQGCAAGEKCATKVESESPFLARTTCVPNGTVPSGQSCERTAGGLGVSSGIDDCQASADTGYECVVGVCTEVCTAIPNSCAGGLCLTQNGLFDDIEGAGVCAPSCDAVAQDCADAGAGCYYHFQENGGACSTVPAAAADQTQNEPCLGPSGIDTGVCFLDGCARGFGPIVPEQDAPMSEFLCAKFCTPSPTDVDHLDHPEGIEDAALGQHSCASPATAPVPGPDESPNDTYQCRFLSSFYTDTEGAPDSLGVCVDKTVWGDCLLQQTEACLADPDPPSPLPPTHPCATMQRGCLPISAFR